MIGTDTAHRRPRGFRFVSSAAVGVSDVQADWQTTGRTDCIAVALTMVLASTLACLAAATPAHAAPPAREGVIAYESNRAGNHEIYTSGGDEIAAARLTTSNAFDFAAAWSPDGTRLAFTSHRDGNAEIYTMAADGSDQTRRTTNAANDYGPAWSPDGRQIAFASNRDGNYEIYTMASDGSGQTRLTTSTAFDGDPAWSPDGTQIAFTSDRDGSDDVCLMAADGSAPARLTSDGARDLAPAWSPDGTQIAFASTRDGNYEIYTMAPDGTAQTNRTHNRAHEEEPDWSPDGARLAFTSDRDGNYEIYTMAPDGADQARHTRNAAFDYAPDWQPVAHPLITPAGLSGGDAPQTAPVVVGLSLTRRDFCIGRACPRARRGTGLRFALVTSARVRFAFERRVSGRWTAGRCTTKPRQGRGGRRCGYFAAAGSFGRPGTAGVNSVRFTGRVAGRALRSGSYRLSLTATAAGGARSAVARTRFRVHPPHRARGSSRRRGGEAQ